MDVIVTQFVFIGLPLFLLCTLFWMLYARSEQNKEIRLKRMVGIFLFWFFLNFLYLMSQFLAPVWYEPSPVVPGLIALRFYLPYFILLSIPFILDIVNQLRSEE